MRQIRLEWYLKQGQVNYVKGELRTVQKEKQMVPAVKLPVQSNATEEEDRPPSNERHKIVTCCSVEHTCMAMYTASRKQNPTVFRIFTIFGTHYPDDKFY